MIEIYQGIIVTTTLLRIVAYLAVPLLRRDQQQGSWRFSFRSRFQLAKLTLLLSITVSKG